MAQQLRELDAFLEDSATHRVGSQTHEGKTPITVKYNTKLKKGNVKKKQKNYQYNSERCEFSS